MNYQYEVALTQGRKANILKGQHTHSSKLTHILRRLFLTLFVVKALACRGRPTCPQSNRKRQFLNIHTAAWPQCADSRMPARLEHKGSDITDEQSLGSQPLFLHMGIRLHVFSQTKRQQPCR